MSIFGTDPNQIPRNVDLGEAAYLDKSELFSDVEIKAIAKSKNVNAVDVFVYDTSKDSDGGAWRKRTQHTSWYNEAPSATRGARKEFPAVAVIVAESTKVTIYDGDDPTLPMWMVFENQGADMLRDGTGYNGGIYGVNGIVGLAGKSNGFAYVNFIVDSGANHNSTGLGVYKGSVAERNDGKGNNTVVGSGIVNSVVNDVAMTVLPNAPIDPATQLPIPTIAVATDGGVSVIKDDGTVVDITGQAESPLYINFSKEHQIVTTWNTRQHVAVYDIPSSDVSYTTYLRAYTHSGAPKLNGYTWNMDAVPYQDNIAIRGIYGSNSLQIIKENIADKTKGLMAYIQADFNTGWMNGDIKLATLSDTDATNVTGTELVTNGTFDTDTDWTKGTGWTISGGVASITTAPNTNNFLQQSVNVEAGKKYQFICDVVSISVGTASVTWTSGTGDVTGDSGDPLARSTVGELRRVFTCVTSGTINLIVNAGSGATLSVDNVTLRVIEEDRSANGNGLQVFGTMYKYLPVATGSDLVGYSGYGYGSYFRQPYNSDLDFGTGDFCVMGWFKTTSGGYLFDRADSSASGGRIRGYISTTAIQLLVNGGYGVNTSANYADGNWHFYAGYRSNNTVSLYVDGKLIASNTIGSYDVSNTSAYLTIGNRTDAGSPFFGGSIALFRISATAPTAEQIAKIYEDEKVLFQPGAQATLYGTSDVVTALAYDEDTNLLHVGTSAGRSVFQGLRRVDNTTDPVGAAISASNNMIVEE